MAGLLSGAVAGLGQAMQFNAQSSIEEKRQAAMLKLKEDATIRAEERQGKRSAASTAAEWEREDQHRQEDRRFGLLDDKTEHQRNLSEIAARGQAYSNLPGNRGGTGGGKPDLSRTDITTLISQLDDNIASKREDFEAQGLGPAEIDTALGPAYQQRQELQSMLPGGSLITGPGGNASQSGSGMDWSMFFDE